MHRIERDMLARIESLHPCVGEDWSCATWIRWLAEPRGSRWLFVTSLLCSTAFCSCTPETTGPRCGNSTIDSGEVCDDGNHDSGDGCRGDCLGLEVCGDGLVDPCEDCDDGEETEICDRDCTFVECGDGVYNPLAEQCIIVDVSSRVASLGGEACDCPCTDCCGNGQIDPGVSPLEECDDGVETALCNADCTVSQCGDGHENLAAGEECDWGESGQCGVNVREGTRGNRDDLPDTCRTDCRRPYCGDGVTDTGAFPDGVVPAEECDDGGLETATCDADCTIPRCGDGKINEAAGEVCDGGGGDTAGCDDDCTAVRCGDGHVNRAAGEECEQHSDCDPSLFCIAATEEGACTCSV